MAEPKYHWAVHSTPELANHCNAWTGHTGGRWIQACRSRKARYLEDSAAEFCAKSQDDPDWFCIPCAKAARLALAKESRDVLQSQVDSEAKEPTQCAT